MFRSSTDTSHQTHLVVAGHIGHTSEFPCQQVLDLIDSVVVNVDCADQHVVGDVVEVAAEFQPGSGSTDVVGGALPLHLQRREHEVNGDKQQHP